MTEDNMDDLKVGQRYVYTRKGLYSTERIDDGVLTAKSESGTHVKFSAPYGHSSGEWYRADEITVLERVKPVPFWIRWAFRLHGFEPWRRV